MIVLITTSVNQIKKMGPNVGRLVHPRMSTGIPATIDSGMVWAADNDAFSGFKVGPYLRMLGNIAGQPGCKFVTAPDVVRDARQTLENFMRWQPIIRECQLPVAYVLQDGIEGVGVPWDMLDAVFLGGSTEAKMSPTFERIAHEAQDRGKWVHMGRVNSIPRIRYAGSIGCDSIDGSKFGRFPSYVERDLLALNHTQQSMNGRLA